MNPVLAVRCTLAAAWSWHRGELTDAELLWSAEGGRAVFVASLHNRAGLRLLARHGPSCQLAVFRTRQRGIWLLAGRHGASRGFQDPCGSVRYAVTGDGLRSLVSRFGRIAQKTPAASGVTNSR